jgi:hypothetical protein
MELRLRENQKDVVEKIINALRRSGYAALQAPTGWGKTITALFTIKELNAKPTLWLEPRLATELHVFQHAVDLNMRVIATAGREKLCLYGYSNIDFLRGVCHSCQFNRLVSLGELDDFGVFADMDFGRVREVGEQMGICPYKLQSFLERFYGYDLVISHFGRAGKLVKSVRPKLIIVDEAHNTVLPVVHRVDVRALRLLLVDKLGFEEGEALGLIRNPESLRIVLRELVDTLILEAVDDNDARQIVEDLLAMLNAQIWFYDEGDEALVGLEVPSMGANVPTLFMSATLPPSLLSTANTIVVKRGWSVPIRIDDRFALTMENIERRKSEIAKHVEKYLEPGTVVFTTLSREDLITGDVIWEDELEGKSPCDFKNKTVVLRTFGRFVEGVNLDCFGRLVLLGFPLLQPTIMKRLEARGINEKDFTTMVAVQRIGRITRSASKPEKLPEIILVDKRFRLIESELMNYEIEVINA